MKNILITHDDLDGAGCRIVFEIYHYDDNKEEWKVINASNNNIDDIANNVLDEYDNSVVVYFADICPSRDMLQRFKDKGFDIRIYDHHRTNFFATWIYENATIIPENDLNEMQSGTSLLYQGLINENNNDKFMNNKVLPILVDIIRSYDTYEWKDTKNFKAKELNILYRLLGMDNFCNRMINKVLENKKDTKLIDDNDMDFVNAYIINEQNNIDKVDPSKIIDCNVKGYRAALLINSIGADTSELGNQFLEKYPQYDIFIKFNLADGGTFAFRCNKDDIDLGKDIAVPIGGGGHPKAAGGPLSNQLKDMIKDVLIKYLNNQKFRVDVIDRNTYNNIDRNKLLLFRKKK